MVAPGVASGEQEAGQIQVTVIARSRSIITKTATVKSATPDPNGANSSASIRVSVASGGKKK